MYVHMAKAQYLYNNAVNPQTENLESRGRDSSRFIISRGGIPRSVGQFPVNLDSGILRLRIPILRIDCTTEFGVSLACDT